MNPRCTGFFALVALLAFSSAPCRTHADTKSATPFPKADVRFEQNATDADVEVVFEVGGADEGLAKLVVVSPDGRTVIDFTAPDKTTLGIRSFHFESPEPQDIAGLKRAYPEGVYTFEGSTVSGLRLRAASALSHELPATVSFAHPTEDAEGVGSDLPEVRWTEVAGVAAYLVEIQEEEGDASIVARLPADVTRFAVPEGFLRPQTEYQWSIGTESNAGNISFVETSFTTAAQK